MTDNDNGSPLSDKDVFEGFDVLDATNVSQKGLCVMNKGPSGSGKSYAAATFPQPIVVAQFDKNEETYLQRIQQGADIKLLRIRTWKDYADRFVPHVTNRLFPARTVVVDTLDFLYQMLKEEVQGNKPRLTQEDWGTLLAKMMLTTGQLVDATKAFTEDQLYYNIVFCTHLKDVTDDSGNLRYRSPAMAGQFKDQVEAYFDYVFLNESYTKSEKVTINGATKLVPNKAYKAYTVPPTQFDTAKGPGLPAVLEPATYPEIMRALGREEEVLELETPTGDENETS